MPNDHDFKHDVDPADKYHVEHVNNDDPSEHEYLIFGGHDYACDIDDCTRRHVLVISPEQQRARDERLIRAALGIVGARGTLADIDARDYDLLIAAADSERRATADPSESADRPADRRTPRNR